MEPRWTDLTGCFDQGMTNAQVLDIVRASDITVAILGVEYGWIFATGEESKRLWSVFRQSCENAVALGCSMIMSAPGPLTGTVKDAIANMKLAGDLAAEFDLKLALEFIPMQPDSIPEQMSQFEDIAVRKPDAVVFAPVDYRQWCPAC